MTRRGTVNTDHYAMTASADRPPPPYVDEVIDRHGERWTRLDDGRWCYALDGAFEPWAAVVDQHGPVTYRVPPKPRPRTVMPGDRVTLHYDPPVTGVVVGVGYPKNLDTWRPEPVLNVRADDGPYEVTLHPTREGVSWIWHPRPQIPPDDWETNPDSTRQFVNGASVASTMIPVAQTVLDDLRRTSGAVERVRGVHTPWDERDPVQVCRGCGRKHPCPTLLALDPHPPERAPLDDLRAAVRALDDIVVGHTTSEWRAYALYVAACDYLASLDAEGEGDA